MVSGVATFLLLLVPCLVAVPVEKRDLTGDSPLFDAKSKRPFCNAFAGCDPRGKKRSELDYDMNMIDTDNGDFQPEMDKMTRQLLLQAKLWEMLKEKLQTRGRWYGENESKFPNYLRKKRTPENIKSKLEPNLQNTSRR